MIQPAAAPVASRVSASCGSEPAMPHSATRTVPMAHITATARYLPRRSPNGPMTSWIEPWAMA